MISISVSDIFYNKHLNDLLLKNDTKINESILNFGTSMYLKENDIINQNNDTRSKLYYEEKINEIEKKYNDIITNYNKKIEEYIDTINKLKDDKVNDISAFIQKGKELTSNEFGKIIDIHLMNIDELKLKNKMLEDNICNINNKLIEVNNYKTNDSYQSINGSLITLNNKFSSYFEKIFKENTAKGAFGENFIENYLTDKFSNSRIIDTSKETASGDILFLFDNLKVLIESKNVQVLKKDDIDKFYRDIEVRTNKDEINSALLISLNETNLVNGERYFHFEIRNRIPVIMISNVFNNNSFIRMAILTLHHLIKNHIFNKEDIMNNDEKIELLISSFNELFDNIKKQIIHLNNDKNIIQKMQESYIKRENDLLNTDKIFSNIFQKFPELSNYSNNKNSMSGESFKTIIDKIQIKISEDSQFIINTKNLENIGIPQHVIKKIGGIKKINNHLNNITL